MTFPRRRSDPLTEPCVRRGPPRDLHPSGDCSVSSITVPDRPGTRWCRPLTGGRGGLSGPRTPDGEGWGGRDLTPSKTGNPKVSSPLSWRVLLTYNSHFEGFPLVTRSRSALLLTVCRVLLVTGDVGSLESPLLTLCSERRDPKCPHDHHIRFNRKGSGTKRTRDVTSPEWCEET